MVTTPSLSQLNQPLVKDKRIAYIVSLRLNSQLVFVDNKLKFNAMARLTSHLLDRCFKPKFNRTVAIDLSIPT